MRNRIRQKINGLYAITQETASDQQLLDNVRPVLMHGARLLQYRCKTLDPATRKRQADLLQSLCSEFNCLFIINDDLELAMQLHADGVHLGRDDLPVAQVRDIAGPALVIGASCYGSLDKAQKMQGEGADYIAFGAVYASATKPQAKTISLDVIRQAKSLNLPIVAIGGITPDNAQPVIEAGANALAVISALYGGGHAPGAIAARFSALFHRQ